jgi:hypothetical protein
MSLAVCGRVHLGGSGRYLKIVDALSTKKGLNFDVNVFLKYFYA